MQRKKLSYAAAATQVDKPPPNALPPDKPGPAQQTSGRKQLHWKNRIEKKELPVAAWTRLRDKKDSLLVRNKTFDLDAIKATLPTPTDGESQVNQQQNNVPASNIPSYALAATSVAQSTGLKGSFSTKPHLPCSLMERAVVQYTIKQDDVGYSYEKVMGKYVINVLFVEIDEPHLHKKWQVVNFEYWCKFVKHFSPRLQKIKLLTKRSDNRLLEALVDNLALNCNIQLIVSYDENLHDRYIRFGNGWIVMIGRGINYFQKVSKYQRRDDYDGRKCLETTVAIFHEDNAQGICIFPQC